MRQNVIKFLIFVIAGFLISCVTSKAKFKPTANSGLEVDHVYIWVSQNAPEASALEQIGLKLFPAVSHHSGNGTSSRWFDFGDRYLELIYFDSSVSQSPTIQADTQERLERSQWQKTGASPFGVGLRRTSMSNEQINLHTFKLQSEWIKKGEYLEVIESHGNTAVPRVFIIPHYMVKDSAQDGKLRRTDTAYAKRLTNSLEIRRMTSVRIQINGKMTDDIEQLTRSGVLDVEKGKNRLMEVTFDNGRQHKHIDLQPDLPLILKY